MARDFVIHRDILIAIRYSRVLDIVFVPTPCLQKFKKEMLGYHPSFF